METTTFTLFMAAMTSFSLLFFAVSRTQYTTSKIIRIIRNVPPPAPAYINIIGSCSAVTAVT